MKSRLHRLEITNFKAFREFKLDLEGRHLLVYGRNGAGKSSFYWALHTFLQSARKQADGVAKYFDPAHPQNLLNIHEQGEGSPKPGEIALTLREMATKIDTRYPISQTNHGTFNQPTILMGDLASDFITYRFFFGFSHFRNSEKFDLWPLFEKEILPFCVPNDGQIPLDCWNAIKSGNPNPNALRGRGGAKAYEKFSTEVDEFATMLLPIVDAISAEAQRFYDEHFAADDPAKVTLKLGVTTPPSFTGTDAWNSVFIAPVVEFGIQVGNQSIERPQMFLNEAKLTQLALSIRFAASLVNLHESDLKLLVLDDLLVSLDMSNRMKVVELLLSDTFADYQKIILTHDLGLFREFQRRLGSNHSEWYSLRLEGNAARMIVTRTEKDEIQKAEDYLRGHDLDEAALSLRKAAEDMARRWREWADGKSIPPGNFLSLTENLRAARNKVAGGLQTSVYEKLVLETPELQRDLIIAASDDDIENNPTLDQKTKGHLKTSRRRLRQMFTKEHVERLRQVKLIDDILKCTERVLNPAAHSGTPPLYESEVQQALALVRQLETTLGGVV